MCIQYQTDVRKYKENVNNVYCTNKKNEMIYHLCRDCKSVCHGQICKCLMYLLMLVILKQWSASVPPHEWKTQHFPEYSFFLSGPQWCFNWYHWQFCTQWLHLCRSKSTYSFETFFGVILSYNFPQGNNNMQGIAPQMEAGQLLVQWYGQSQTGGSWMSSPKKYDNWCISTQVVWVFAILLKFQPTQEIAANKGTVVNDEAL